MYIYWMLLFLLLTNNVISSTTERSSTLNTLSNSVSITTVTSSTDKRTIQASPQASTTVWRSTLNTLSNSVSITTVTSNTDKQTIQACHQVTTTEGQHVTTILNTSDITVVTSSSDDRTNTQPSTKTSDESSKYYTVLTTSETVPMSTHSSITEASQTGQVSSTFTAVDSLFTSQTTGLAPSFPIYETMSTEDLPTKPATVSIEYVSNNIAKDTISNKQPLIISFVSSILLVAAIVTLICVKRNRLKTFLLKQEEREMENITNEDGADKDKDKLKDDSVSYIAVEAVENKTTSATIEKSEDDDTHEKCKVTSDGQDVCGSMQASEKT